MGALAVQQVVPFLEHRERCLKNTLPLVYSLAHKMTPRRDDLEDLISEGTIAVLKAYDRFDPGRGVKFSTFAFPAIKGAMSNYIRDHSSNIRASTEAVSIGRLIYKNKLHHLSENEIADQLNISLAQVRFGLQYILTFRQASLDQTLPEGAHTLHDITGEEDSHSLFFLREFIGTLQGNEPRIFLDLVNNGHLDMAKMNNLSPMAANDVVREIKRKFKSFMEISESEVRKMGDSKVQTRKLSAGEAKQHGVTTVLDSIEWFANASSPANASVGVTGTGLHFNQLAAKKLDVAVKQFIQVGFNADLKRIVIRKAESGIKLSKGYESGAVGASAKQLCSWLASKNISRRRYALEYDETAEVYFLQVEVATEKR
jgi:DNA-directed RNA polymerase specialized sigma24 family protein